VGGSLQRHPYVHPAGNPSFSAGSGGQDCGRPVGLAAREWKEPRHAARLVLERSGEIDGNLYFVLDPAAKALEGKQPLAAALLRRATVEDTLEGTKAKRYRHAARHLRECRALEAAVGDHGGFETHDAFLARLRARMIASGYTYAAEARGAVHAIRWRGTEVWARVLAALQAEADAKREVGWYPALLQHGKPEGGESSEGHLLRNRVTPQGCGESSERSGELSERRPQMIKRLRTLSRGKR
jgi:hypothetical protein